jgi:hypothetical protein
MTGKPEVTFSGFQADSDEVCPEVLVLYLKRPRVKIYRTDGL